MFNLLKLFKRKKEGAPPEGETSAEDGETTAQGESAEGGEESAKTEGEASPAAAPQGGGGGAALIKMQTDMDRLKGAVEGFSEVRKGLTERISSVNEQIGELRAMILDRDRTIQEIELKALKAADLVDSVKPDKLMIELQKEDAKFEALKANLEGNEAILNRVMDELKGMRKKLEFYRGVDEIVKLSEEVKEELVQIKKVEANVNIQADKVETIYSELRKKFKDIDVFNDSLSELKVTVQQNQRDVESMKTKVSSLATKDELDKLVQKVQRYIDALKEINRSSALSKDVTQLKSILEGFK